MSFLKDFKEDLSLAVSELLPQEEEKAATGEKASEKKMESRASQERPEEAKTKSKSHPKHVEKKNQKTAEREAGNDSVSEKTEQKSMRKSVKDDEKEEVHLEETDLKGEINLDALLQSEAHMEAAPLEDFFLKEEEPGKEADMKALDASSEEEKSPKAEEVKNKTEILEEEETMDEMMTGKMETEEFNLDGMDVIQGVELTAPEPKQETKRSSEVATITAGTRINGDIESDGSLEILGTINGNVTCNGKLTITGTIVGNSNADEVYADSAKVEGEINSEGAVKIGLGSVILGDVKATSAVIAGAIRGDIDVHGPVIVDTSAVVMGNIKSRSVQINNGAVIEGFCSQCYSDISVKNFFEENKPAIEKKAGDKKSGAEKK